MREELERRGTAAAADVLRSRTEFLAAEWQIECAGDPPLPDPAALLLGLAEAVSGLDQEAEPRPADSLHELTTVLAEQGPDLDVLVRHLGGLREVLHRQVVTELAPEIAVYVQYELSSAIDTLIEMCTSDATSSLQEAAFVDPLTGLLNRRALERDLGRELALAARHGHEVSMVIGDLDGLKTINDTLGHAAGDEALCSLAAAVQSALRAGDAGYRIGGDEFVILLPMSSASDVAGVVERVTAADAPAFGWGQATFPDDGTDAAALLDLADHRLIAGRRGTGHHNPVTASPTPEPNAESRPKPVAAARRRRHPFLTTTLAVALSGGAGLASAAAGQLPRPAQDWAHDVLARVGVSVPAASTAGDQTGGARTARRPQVTRTQDLLTVHRGEPGVLGAAGDDARDLPPATPELVPVPGAVPATAPAVAPPIRTSAAGTVASRPVSMAGSGAPGATAVVVVPPEVASDDRLDVPGSPGPGDPDTAVPSQPELVEPADQSRPEVPAPGDAEPPVPPGLERGTPDRGTPAPDGGIGRIDKPDPPRQGPVRRWLHRFVGDLGRD